MARAAADSEFHYGGKNTTDPTDSCFRRIPQPEACAPLSVEWHTTYLVMMGEKKFINESIEDHEFAAVAGYAHSRTSSCFQNSLSHNGVLWFNDQFWIDPVSNLLEPGPCFFVEECTVACYVVAIRAGSADPVPSFAGATQTFVYHYTDPNNVDWETREYAGSVGYFWVVTIKETFTDSADNLEGGTSNRGGPTPATAPNTHKGQPNGADNFYINGCDGADAPTMPDCYQGGIDHNPEGNGSNPRKYNFVVLIDMLKLGGAPGNLTAAGCAAVASDDGNSHASQGPHLGECPHMHKINAVDLWFSDSQPGDTGGAVRDYVSTSAYHS